MARDKLIDIVIAKWAGRFVINGVPLSDFQEVTASLERWDDWCRAWSARCRSSGSGVRLSRRSARVSCSRCGR